MERNGWLVAGRIAALIVLNIISVIALIVLCAMRGSLKERGVRILPQAQTYADDGYRVPFAVDKPHNSAAVKSSAPDEDYIGPFTSGPPIEVTIDLNAQQPAWIPAPARAPAAPVVVRRAATKAGLTKEDVYLERREMTHESVPEDVVYIDKSAQELEVGDLVVIRRSSGALNYAVVDSVDPRGAMAEFKSVGQAQSPYYQKLAAPFLVGVVRSWDAVEVEYTFEQAIEILQGVRKSYRWTDAQFRAFEVASGSNIDHPEVARCLDLLQGNFQKEQISNVQAFIKRLEGKSTIRKSLGIARMNARHPLQLGQLVLVEPLSDKHTLQFGYVAEFPKTDDPQLNLHLPKIKYYSYNPEYHPGGSLSLMLEGRVSLDRMYTPRPSDIKAFTSVEKSRYFQQISTILDRLHSEGKI